MPAFTDFPDDESAINRPTCSYIEFRKDQIESASMLDITFETSYSTSDEGEEEEEKRAVVSRQGVVASCLEDIHDVPAMLNVDPGPAAVEASSELVRRHSLSAPEIAFVRKTSAMQLNQTEERANKFIADEVEKYQAKQQEDQHQHQPQPHQDGQTNEPTWMREAALTLLSPAVKVLASVDRLCFDPTYGPCTACIEKKTCAICNHALSPQEVLARGRDLQLDCCKEAAKRHPGEQDGKPLVVCNACLVILTHRTTKGNRAGHCPLCESWIRVEMNHQVDPDVSAQKMSEVHRVKQIQSWGTCRGCQCRRMTLVEKESGLCGKCFLAREQPLAYDCMECGTTQKIPYPLYRHQSSPQSHSQKPWKCNGSCQTQTFWRLCADQLRLVPLFDAPWEDHDWQLEARRRVTIVHDLVVQEEDPGASTGSSCAIM